MSAHVYVSVCACICVYLCVFLCMHVSVYVCMCLCVYTWAPVEVRRQPLGLLTARPVYSVGSWNQIRFGAIIFTH